MTDSLPEMPDGFSRALFDPLALCALEYEVCLEQSQEHATAASFMLCAYRLLEFFAGYPALQSIGLTLVASVDSAVDSGTGAVQLRIEHHSKVVATGADIGLADPLAADSFVRATLPWKRLGQGHLLVERTGSEVQTYLGAASDERALREACVYELARALRAAIGPLDIVHGSSALG